MNPTVTPLIAEGNDIGDTPIQEKTMPLHNIFCVKEYGNFLSFKLSVIVVINKINKYITAKL